MIDCKAFRAYVIFNWQARWSLNDWLQSLLSIEWLIAKLTEHWMIYCQACWALNNWLPSLQSIEWLIAKPAEQWMNDCKACLSLNDWLQSLHSIAWMIAYREHWKIDCKAGHGSHIEKGYCILSYLAHHLMQWFTHSNWTLNHINPNNSKPKGINPSDIFLNATLTKWH